MSPSRVTLRRSIPRQGVRSGAVMGDRMRLCRIGTDEAVDTRSSSTISGDPRSIAAGAEGETGVTRLLIVEDEERLGEIMARVFRGERYIVEVVGDGASGLELALNGSFDAIILDRMLPVLDGVDVLRRLREQRIGTPVLMLTARAEVDERIEGLNAGADDYLGKPFSLDELVARIAALVRRRDRPLQPKVGTFADVMIDFGTGAVTCDGVLIALSPQEYRLLEVLMHSHGTVIERDRILERVWGYDADPRGNVVELYIHYLRRKIGEVSPDAAKLITTVRGIGYMLAKGQT